MQRQFENENWAAWEVLRLVSAVTYPNLERDPEYLTLEPVLKKLLEELISGFGNK